MLLLLAVTMLIGGCAQSSPEHVGSPSVSYTEPPLPAAATPAPETGTTPAPAPEKDCGDPTASLRPFPDTDSAPPMPTVDAIRARGRLVVGLDTGSNLMSFRDPATGAIQGFDVDIAREIRGTCSAIPTGSSTASSRRRIARRHCRSRWSTSSPRR